MINLFQKQKWANQQVTLIRKSMIFFNCRFWRPVTIQHTFRYLVIPLVMVGVGLVISCYRKAAGCGRESKNSTTLPQIVLYSILVCEWKGDFFLTWLDFICTSFDTNTMWLNVYSEELWLKKTSDCILSCAFCLSSQLANKNGKFVVGQFFKC